MKEKKNAIELEDVCIHYSIMNHVSIRKTFLHKKKRKEVFEAVKHVTFSVGEGDILGIIGKNGSGKSTLLKSIAGVFSPNAGRIDLKGHSVSLMSLGVGFKDTLSGRENIVLSGMLLGFSEKEIEERAQDIIDFAEIGEFIDRPVRTYSITAMLETDIMLVDEVLSVGDEQFRKKSLNKMKELINDRKRTVIIVSHSISTLKELCDQVLWLHDGQVRRIGKTDEVLGEYAAYMAPADRKQDGRRV